MEAQRVRQIIPFLNYGELRKKKIVPKQTMFTGIKKGGSFPSVARRMGYPTFGLFIDHLIRHILQNRDKSWEEALYPTYVETARMMLMPVIDQKYFTAKDHHYYDALQTLVEEKFGTAERVEIEPEWIQGDIMGHPDLIVDGVIYDIKVSGSFNAMRIDCIHQILCYYVLAKKLGKDVHSVGLFLPAQNDVVVYNLEDWDYEEFWGVLNEVAELRKGLMPDEETKMIFSTFVYPHVGSHRRKETTIYKTLVGPGTRWPNRAIQIFLSGRLQVKFKISAKDRKQSAELIAKHGLKTFVHSPYSLNLSRKYDDDWVVESLVEHLKCAAEMNFMGVVVHCGKQAKMEFDEAYENMYTSVVESAKHATRECPLLIETSAGEKGELLADPEDMAVFYTSLPEEIRDRVKICIDTCHVFAAGYLPVDYLRVMQQNNIPIGLIHYNDSLGPLGCCRDRHAPLGQGYVGLKNLLPIGEYAVTEGIGMVVE